jgi:predicted DsbA family dithiol-disulfide isomerase
MDTPRRHTAVSQKWTRMRPRIVIYGDFNCPYSYLASSRADALLEQGRLDLEWRAVEQDQSIPRSGWPVERTAGTCLESEIEDVMSKLEPDESFSIRLPAVLSNTALATAAFAACHGRSAPLLRQRLFAALWHEGRDIGDPVELDRILGRPAAMDSLVATHWRASWRGFERPALPMLVLPTGWVLRGTEALDHLTSMRAHP